MGGGLKLAAADVALGGAERGVPRAKLAHARGALLPIVFVSQPPLHLGHNTLGDLLAALRRARASATLNLRDGPRSHAIHLRGGMVQAVEYASVTPRFGDVVSAVGAVPREHVERVLAKHHGGQWRVGQRLVAEGMLSHRERDRLLEAQRAHRLECLYALDEATVVLSPPRPLPAGSAEQPPMTERSVFHGRPRGRARE